MSDNDKKDGFEQFFIGVYQDGDNGLHRVVIGLPGNRKFDVSAEAALKLCTIIDELDRRKFSPVTPVFMAYIISEFGFDALLQFRKHLQEMAEFAITSNRHLTGAQALPVRRLDPKSLLN